MVDGPNEVPSANPAPEPQEHVEQANDDGDDDDDADDEHEDAECASCAERAQNYTLLHQMAESPYYFAMGFFLIGVMIQASHPFVNWQFIWFMLMQSVMTIVSIFGGVCIGLVVPLYFPFVTGFINVWGVTCGCPIRMKMMEADAWNRENLAHLQAQ